MFLSYPPGQLGEANVCILSVAGSKSPPHSLGTDEKIGIYVGELVSLILLAYVIMCFNFKIQISDDGRCTSLSKKLLGSYQFNYFVTCLYFFGYLKSLLSCK